MRTRIGEPYAVLAGRLPARRQGGASEGAASLRSAPVENGEHFLYRLATLNRIYVS